MRTGNGSGTDPIRVTCEGCGAPLGFDILRQTYRCPHCGRDAETREADAAGMRWRTFLATEAAPAAAAAAVYACSACGANVLFGSGEASGTCAFCGSRLIRRDLVSKKQIPDLIIPFFLTRDEAKERLRVWAEKHRLKPEARAVKAALESLQGSYLPYRLVRGPVQGVVQRDATTRKYECRGYIEGTAIAATGRLDNAVLNAAEPFDWSKAMEFRPEYVAGHGALLADLGGAETEERIREETEEAFLPEVERVMQTTGVRVDVRMEDLSVLSAMLPFYFLKEGDLLAVVNGQTGRVAVSGGRKKVSFPWAIEPLLYTVLLTFLLGLWSGFSLEMMVYGGAVIAIIAFSVMEQGRTSLVRNILLRSRSARARREGEPLTSEEGRNGLKNPFDNTPVFIEKGRSGSPVPVRIRFYPFRRVIAIIWNAFSTLFLPALIAGAIRILELRGEGGRFFDGFDLTGGAAWYTLAAFLVFLYLLKGVRRDVYDRPYIYEILPDGKKKLIGTRRDRKVGVVSMFGMGETDERGRPITLFWYITHTGGLGWFLGGTMLFLLIGSVAAILG